jgi:hypothetical protein
LLELLAIGKVRFQISPNIDEDQTSKVPIVGFTSGADQCLILNTAYLEVQKHLRGDVSLGHSARAIGLELWKKGLIKDKETIVKRLNKRGVRIVRLNPDRFSADFDVDEKSK